MTPTRSRRAAATAGSSDEPERAHDTMTARAVHEIVARYCDLRLQPGRAFTESELSEELALGKTPVREALIILGVEGMVIPRPRSGYRVAPITVRDARDLFAVVRPLFAESVELTAGTEIDGARRLRIEDLRLGMDPAEGDDGHLTAAFVEFIRAFAFLSGNTRLQRTLGRQLYDLSRVVLLVLRTRTPARLPSASPVVTALDHRDPVAAAAAARTYIDEWRDLVVGALLSSDALMSVDVAVPGQAPTRPRQAAPVARKRAVVKKTPAKKAAAKKTPAKRTPAKRTPAKKAAAKKAGHRSR